MCAIAGLYDVAGQAVEPSVLERMVCLQAHRGPDGEGYVLLDVQGREQPVALKGRLTDALGASPRRYTIALGHRRLAIVDLSPLGHQPMATEDGRCWVTYNGEIYNYVELREGAGRDTGSALHPTPKSCSRPTGNGAKPASRVSTGCSRSPSGTGTAAGFFAPETAWA